MFKTPLVLALSLTAGTGLALAAQDGYGKKQAGYEDSYEAKPLTAEQRAEVAQVFGELIQARKALPVAAGATCECSDEGACAPCETIERSSEKLVKFLVKQPDSWEVVTPLVESAFLDDGATEQDRDSLLQVLGWTRSERVLTIGAALWEAGPDKFTENHILVFAENGSEPLMDEARKRAKKSVRPAALVALRAHKYAQWSKKSASKASLAASSKSDGEKAEEIDEAQIERDLKTAKRALVKASKVRSVSRENALDALLAAACLEQLGEEGRLLDVQTKLHTAVITALDSGRLDEARDLALLADFAHEASGEMQISYMDMRCKAHCQERSKEVATADQVFELIERITPM